MDQLDIFGGINLDHTILSGLIDYQPGLFTRLESDQLLKKLIAGVSWEQKSVTMYGKEMLTPRLNAWFGDQDADHSIAGDGSKPLPWTDDLLFIRERVEKASGTKFNSVLLNFYRDGNDSVAWHDDMDKIPGRNRTVGSVSFGEVRLFDIRNKADHKMKFSIPLEHGSYLLMKGDFQQDWDHRIAKSTKPMKERINLTFRISRTKDDML
jgi:alkylated DNA repair dioxygenase AlkB